MEYTYNMGEIRQVIDTVLMRELGADEHSGVTDSECLDTGSVVEKGELDAEEAEKQLNNITAEDGSVRGVIPACSSDSITVDTECSKMETVIEERICTPDQTLVTEDISLKLVLTYFFYTDDSTDDVKQPDDEVSAISEHITEQSEKDSSADSHLSDSGDFDADVDSLDNSSSGQSYKLQSFSMMNIFDSVCENNYDFTGSLDFGDGNLYRERVGSDSDKDTLDWYTDSSEDALSSRPEEENACACAPPTDDSSVKGDSISRGDYSPDSTLDTKYYKGSTFSVSKVNSEIRHKLVRRLFRKVFPRKKYVVNKKK